MRWIMAAFYLVAGIGHLARPEAFLPIVPAWVPLPREIVLLTGICEIAGALALLTPRFRVFAGTMLALYALCVWPANIKHAIEGVPLPPIPDNWWYHGPRLALQPVLIWWALFCCSVSQSASVPLGALSFLPDFVARPEVAFFGAAAGGLAASRASRSARNFSVLARIASADASYSAIAFLPSA